MTNFECLWRLRDAFRRCFRLGRWKRADGNLTEDATLVLDRLRVFCRADTSCFDADARAHALLEGRREVWIEIQNTLNIDDVTLLKLKEPDDE